MAAPDTATARIAAPTMPANMAGTDHPAYPAAGTMAAACIALTMIELGLDANDCGAGFANAAATPEITRVIFAVKRDHEIAQNAAKRRALGRKLYTCNL